MLSAVPVAAVPVTGAATPGSSLNDAAAAAFRDHGIEHKYVCHGVSEYVS